MINHAPNQLEAVLEKATKDAMFQTDFFRRFCTFDVYAILLSELPAGQTTLKRGTAIQLEEAEYNGKRYIPAFTSLAHLQAFAKRDAKYISMPGLELCKMLQMRELLLNPGAPYGKIFTRAEMDAIVAGKYSPESLVEKPASSGVLKKLFGRK